MSLFNKLNDLLKHTKENLKEVDLTNYVFICSNEFKCKRKEYKGFKIYFEEKIKEDTIYFMPSPYFNDYKL